MKHNPVESSPVKRPVEHLLTNHSLIKHRLKKPHPLWVAISLAITSHSSWGHGELAPSTITEEVVVSASPLEKPASENTHPVTVLSGDALLQQASATLGETLQHQAGISSASFGPGVGSPVIRGMGANRVKVMQDNLDTLDAANASSDHANSVEPLLADSVEVLRGPQTLRFGNGAIGGVVNVVDSRVPRQSLSGSKGALETRHSSASDETSTVLRLDGGLTPQFAWHLDGIYRDSNNTDIDGSADSHGGEETTHGFIANTDSQTSSGSIGGSWIGDRGYLGLSVNYQENNYGIPPGGHAHDDEHDEEHAEEEAELVRIAMRQTRYDLKGELQDPIQGFEKARLRLGYVDYQHTELENGSDGTRFDSEALEGRLELIHNPLQGWQGAVGIQWLDRDFGALGDEAFIPQSAIRNIGLFVIEEKTLGKALIELGARVENQQIDPESGQSRDHDTLSLSAASKYTLTDTQQLHFSLSRAQRAPGIEELYSFGPHLASQSFDLGNAELDNETSLNTELGYRYEDRHSFALTLFHNRIDDFIYKHNSGVEDTDSELMIFAYSQQQATFTGAEIEAAINLTAQWQWSLFADTVHAEFEDGSDVPRTPPARFGTELSYTADNWTTGIKALHALAQKHPGDFEEPTGSFTRLDGYITWHLPGTTLFIKATNLLNDDIRHATSYLRDVAPEAGRGFAVGARFTF